MKRLANECHESLLSNGRVQQALCKNIIRILLLVVAFTTISINGNAQNDRQRMTREQVAETQAKYIAKKMSLDETTTKKYIDTYCQYQKEVWALGPRPKTVEERFDHSQKILNLRKKYYSKYKVFLTDGQIDQAYRLEREMMSRLGHSANKKHPRSK